MSKVIALLLAVISVLGGLYLADAAGLIDLTPGPAPRADSLWSVTILPTSDTDRTESESISPDGHTITWTLTDPNMDGLGDVNLDIRVVNQNIGATDERWAFSASLTFVSTTTASGAPGAQPIVNLTDINSRYAITWSLTDAGAPSLSQSGESATSSNWVTGASDSLNADFEMNPTALDDVAPGTPGRIEVVVGGITLVVNLLEGA